MNQIVLLPGSAGVLAGVLAGRDAGAPRFMESIYENNFGMPALN